jgi:branched-chain amino acid transport system substrate-binding protein
MSSFIDRAAVLAADTQRSTGWVWAVAAGLAIALLLMYHVVSNAISTLPDEIRDRLRGSLRSNVRPLAVATAVLLWTVTYGLYSVAVTPTSSATSTSVAAGAARTNSGQASGASGSPSASQSSGGAPVVGGGGTSGGAAGATGGFSIGGTNSPTGDGTSGPSPFVIKPVNLYSGDADTVGITPDTLYLCGHAPLSLGALLDTKPEDVMVYWKYLNDHGGIQGRQVQMTLQDDQYSASQSVPAAQKCAEQSPAPFLIFGALGSDVIPPVREWAEQNHQLYLYGFTIKAGSENYRYSYSTTISQEDLSTLLGNAAVQKYAGKKVGVVWRNSSNFQPGRDAFKQAVSRGGGQIVADIPVAENQGNYTQEVIELRNSGAEVVFMLDDAFGQTNMMKQAKSQLYNPQWLVFAFNLQTTTLGNDALTPPIAGSNLAPAYKCHTFDGPYASYGAEIREFEAAYLKYDPNLDLCGLAGDVAWQSWVGFRGFAAAFDACGRDCTRNKFAGLLEGGYKNTVGAACEVDFSRDAHHGGYRADFFQAYQAADGKAAWQSPERCLSASG